MRLVISGNSGSGNLIHYNSNIPVIYGTQNIPQGVQTLPSKLDWNISVLLRTHTPSSIQHTHPSHNQTPPLFSSHCPHSCHFSRQSTIIHSSSSIHAFMHSAISPPIRHSTPPLRLVRLVRKQLMELSSAKTLHLLLYPLSDDSVGIVNPCIHTCTQAPFLMTPG